MIAGTDESLRISTKHQVLPKVEPEFDVNSAYPDLKRQIYEAIDTESSTTTRKIDDDTSYSKEDILHILENFNVVVAGGATANIIYALKHNLSIADKINDIDVFIQGSYISALLSELSLRASLNDAKTGDARDYEILTRIMRTPKSAYIASEESTLVFQSFRAGNVNFILYGSRLVSTVDGMNNILSRATSGYTNALYIKDAAPAAEILSSFDLSCCKAGISFKNKCIYTTPDFDKFLRNKVITVTNRINHVSVNTLMRALKKEKLLTGARFYAKEYMESLFVKMLLRSTRDNLICFGSKDENHFFYLSKEKEFNDLMREENFIPFLKKHYNEEAFENESTFDICYKLDTTFMELPSNFSKWKNVCDPVANNLYVQGSFYRKSPEFSEKWLSFFSLSFLSLGARGQRNEVRGKLLFGSDLYNLLSTINFFKRDFNESLLKEISRDSGAHFRRVDLAQLTFKILHRTGEVTPQAMSEIYSRFSKLWHLGNLFSERNKTSQVSFNTAIGALESFVDRNDTLLTTLFSESGPFYTELKNLSIKEDLPTQKQFKYKLKLAAFEKRKLARQITTKEDLIEEGERMGHCVGGYYQSVREGTCYIFSLTIKENFSTLEVRKNSAGKFYIHQHQKRFNKHPERENVALAMSLVNLLNGVTRKGCFVETIKTETQEPCATYRAA